MIVATMQGASRADNYAHVTARDGELLAGAAKQACIDEIFEAADGVRVDEIGEGVRRLDGGFFGGVSRGSRGLCGGSRGANGSRGGLLLCTLYHTQRDDGGRRRLVVFVIDECAASESRGAAEWGAWLDAKSSAANSNLSAAGAINTAAAAGGKTGAARDVILRTFAVMGVEVARFDALYERFCIREQRKKIGALCVAGAAVAVGIGAFCR